jgi:hypothetical protein
VAGWGHQRGEPGHELHRRHEPHLFGVFDAIADPAIVEQREALKGKRGPGAVAQQALAGGEQPARNAHAGVKIEPKVLSAQALALPGPGAAGVPPAHVILTGMGQTLQVTHAQAASQAAHPRGVRLRTAGKLFALFGAEIAVPFEPAHGAQGDGCHDLFQIEAGGDAVSQRVDALSRGIRYEDRVGDDDVPMNVQVEA